jgi:hypothetical protein
MSVTRDGKEPSAFELERFDWAGPDQLEVIGTFAEVPATLSAEPLLVVHGEGGSYELPRVDDAPEEPKPGVPWHAAFAWQEPPDAFTTAELRLGDVLVELPGLHPGGGAAEPLTLRSRTASSRSGAERLHRETELLAARERTYELQRELERARAAVARAMADLDTERAGREEDAARFRDGLASVERAASDELAQARAELEAAAGARAQAERLRIELSTAEERALARQAAIDAAADAMEQVLRRLRTASEEALAEGDTQRP